LGGERRERRRGKASLVDGAVRFTRTQHIATKHDGKEKARD
jgi:hypothetical protein